MRQGPFRSAEATSDSARVRNWSRRRAAAENSTVAAAPLVVLAFCGRVAEVCRRTLPSPARLNGTENPETPKGRARGVAHKPVIVSTCRGKCSNPQCQGSLSFRHVSAMERTPGCRSISATSRPYRKTGDPWAARRSLVSTCERFARGSSVREAFSERSIGRGSWCSAVRGSPKL
jgi:hypothetical protein